MGSSRYGNSCADFFCLGGEEVGCREERGRGYGGRFPLFVLKSYHESMIMCELENLGNLNENWQSSVLR
jgi:hypothetical protein